MVIDNLQSRNIYLCLQKKYFAHRIFLTIKNILTLYHKMKSINHVSKKKKNPRERYCNSIIFLLNDVPGINDDQTPYSFRSFLLIINQNHSSMKCNEEINKERK